MDAFDVVLKHIDEKVMQLKDAVCSERIDSMETYKQLCGEIRGLQTARGYVLDMKDKLEDQVTRPPHVFIFGDLSMAGWFFKAWKDKHYEAQ